jgi:outer membrane protein assembly factor BamD
LLIKRLLPIAALLIVITACSHKVDTSSMSAEEHFNYAMSLFNDEDYEYSITEFQAILLNNAGSSVSDDAQYYLAMSYFKRKQYYLAAYEFSKLIRDIPASPFVPDAQYQLAESYYKQSPNVALDQTFTKKSIEEFQSFINFFPTNPKAVEAENKIKEMNIKLAEKEYNSAQIYERMEYYGAAIKYYTLVVDTYHDTKFAPEALYHRIKLEMDKGQKQKVANDIGLFLSRYPESPRAKDVKELDTSMEKK